MTIPFGNLQRQYRQVREAIDAATRAVYDSGWFVLGPQVRQFEAQFAEFCGAEYAVGVGSGTEALHLALVAAGVRPGNEVITVANTCVPTVAAISSAGAMPVFVDIDETRFTMQPTLLESRITAKTAAIVPVHLYGQCADMATILSIADAHGIPVIEDCAQAHGAQYAGRSAGILGLAGAFSFYPSKNLGAYGDGGMVVTNSPEVAETVRKLRNYGQADRYRHSIKGVNSRLDELQAALLSAKLPYLPAWNQRRRQIAARYSAAFASIDVQCPHEAEGCMHVYHLYVLRVQHRDDFQKRMKDAGISTLVHYPIPVHLQESYAECRAQGQHLPITERLAAEIVSIPVYPELTDDEVDYIITTMLAMHA